MAKRRPSGDGMVRKREDGRWEGRIVIGHKENGGSIFQYIYADTQKELTAKLRQNIDACQGIDLTEESRMTLGEWLDIWLNERVADLVRPTTLDGYRKDMEHHVKPYLGQKPLLKVAAEDLTNLYTQLLEHGRLTTRNGQVPGLSAATVRGIHTTLHHALKTAVEEGVLPSNPADQAVAPKITRTAKKILNNEQVDVFLKTLKGNPIWHDFFYTEMTTGLRRGELCGLKWEDFDSEAGTLKVRRTIHAGKRGSSDGGRPQDIRWNADHPAAVQYGAVPAKAPGDRPDRVDFSKPNQTGTAHRSWQRISATEADFEKGGAPWHPVPRSAAHLCHPRTHQRCGCQDVIQHPGPY